MLKSFGIDNIYHFHKKSLLTVNLIVKCNFISIRCKIIVHTNYVSGKKDEDQSAKPKERPSLPELPEFFEGAHFLLYGEFEHTERRFLNRYITAYNG